MRGKSYSYNFVGNNGNFYFGIAIAQALVAFSRRNDYDAVLTDGEHIGIAGELTGGRTRGQERDDVGLGKRRFAGETNLRIIRPAVDVRVDLVIAEPGLRL